MKGFISSALAAFALISSTLARPSFPGRSLVPRTDAPPNPPCPNYTPYTYAGCFKEEDPKSLEYNPNLDFNTMTIETCTATCKSNGFRYAGLIYYGNCVCGTRLPTPAPESECNAPCTGNSAQICGADKRISIYQDPTYQTVDPATVQYTSLGCYTEAPGFRAVPYQQTQLSSSSLTTGACLSACASKGYALAATEFGGECFCGQMLTSGSTKAPESECNMACTGNANEICGGQSRLNLYEAKVLESTEPCGQTPPTPSTCDGTAYGYVAGKSTTFISLGIGSNWGWVIQGATPISGTLYMGAGGNDLSKGTIVGTFSIAKVGSNLVVTYKVDAPYSLSSTHFFNGKTYPSKIAPGQFGNTHDGLAAGTTTDSFTIPFDATKTTYIVHAGISGPC